MSFFKEMFSETGNISCLRFICTLVIVVILTQWFISSMVSLIWPAIEYDGMKITELIAILGLVLGKLGQKKIEKK